MLKLKMTGKNFSLGILKLLHIRFVENGFKLWYNYVKVNSICGYLFLQYNIIQNPAQGALGGKRENWNLAHVENGFDYSNFRYLPLGE